MFKYKDPLVGGAGLGVRGGKLKPLCIIKRVHCPFSSACVVVGVWFPSLGRACTSLTSPGLPRCGTPGPFDGPQWPHLAPRSIYMSVAVFMGMMVISASFVNGLVIIVSIRYKKLRSPLNYILVNLAVADLLVTLFGSTVSFSNNISGFFMLGKKLCEFEGFMVSVTGKNVSLQSSAGWSQRPHTAFCNVPPLTPQSIAAGFKTTVDS